MSTTSYKHRGHQHALLSKKPLPMIEYLTDWHHFYPQFEAYCRDNGVKHHGTNADTRLILLKLCMKPGSEAEGFANWIVENGAKDVNHFVHAFGVCGDVSILKESLQDSLDKRQVKPSHCEVCDATPRSECGSCALYRAQAAQKHRAAVTPPKTVHSHGASLPQQSHKCLKEQANLPQYHNTKPAYRDLSHVCERPSEPLTRTKFSPHVGSSACIHATPVETGAAQCQYHPRTIDQGLSECAEGHPHPSTSHSDPVPAPQHHFCTEHDHSPLFGDLHYPRHFHEH